MGGRRMGGDEVVVTVLFGQKRPSRLEGLIDLGYRGDSAAERIGSASFFRNPPPPPPPRDK